MSNSKKISFSKGEEKMDRISILPEPILSHMLSFLPTKTSVSTSALSKRWKGVWTTVPCLSFGSSDFMDILVDPDPVYKVLNSIQVPSLQLSLNLTQVEEGQHQRVNQWISSAINRQLEVMRLNLNTFAEPPVRIPSIVFASNSLVSLTLSNDIVVDIPDNAKLPSLKYLQLERVWYENVGTFSRLLSSCIILEDLTVERSWYDNIGGLDITVPTLKKLNLKVPRTGARLCNLLINTPSLEKIEFGELVNWGSKVNNLSNLMEAVLHIDRTRRVIKELGNVQRLSLSEDVSWSIFCDMTLKLPTFSNLIYLEITCCCDHWDGLSAFLKASHNIKTLVFHIRVKSQHMSRSCDKTMKTVPKCISLSLTTVKLTGFYDVECSRKLIQYILRNAGNLKHMHIKTALEIKRCHWERLLRCPKASAECAISFLDSSGKEIKM